MVEFKRGENHPGSIWNPQKNKAIKFVDGICKTDDELEIEILTKEGYSILSKKEVEKNTKKKVEKNIEKKPLKKIKPTKKEK